MKHLCNAILITVLFFATNIIAQEFLPLRLGNSWTYKTGSSPYFKYTNWRDIDTNYQIGGYTYHRITNTSDTSYNLYMRLDTTTGTYYKYHSLVTPQLTAPYYKTNFSLNDTLAYGFHSTKIKLFLINEWDDSLFNCSAHVKQIAFDYQLGGSWIFWTEKFGTWFAVSLEKNNNEELSRLLTGCVIDNIVYGDTSTTLGIDKSELITKGFLLSQNYPNPFNPETSISFRLNKSGEITIRVFNSLGIEVSKLVDEYMHDGLHTVKFNASDLPSGIYYYQLKSGIHSEVKKMLFLK